MAHTKKHAAAVNQQEVYELFSECQLLSDEVKTFWLERIASVPRERFADIKRAITEGQKEMETEYEQYVAREAEITNKCENQLKLIAMQSALGDIVPTPKPKKSYVDQVLDDDFMRDLNSFDS